MIQKGREKMMERAKEHVACFLEASEKKLNGDERKKFMTECRAK